ncbi:MAG: uracil-DNA glycosylase [Bacteroidaceae bacterium]
MFLPTTTIDSTWQQELSDEFSKDYFLALDQFVEEEYSTTTIYPPKDTIFSAFNLCSYNAVKVVIIGQDPYHGEGEAHGLSFSVNDGIKQPPSLVNIFKALKEDIGIERPDSGSLERWAKQGVLLLNTVLTVQKDKAHSHKNKGWETFTDAVIHHLASKKEHLVFLLWGNPAQKKGAFIDTDKHLVLKSVHPSPLSAYRGFMKCKHFSLANNYLKKQHKQPITW